MSYYLIRIGEGSKYIDVAHKGKFVAIGWGQVGNLSIFKDSNAIKKALAKTTYNYTPSQLGQQTGQIYRFAKEMQNGDIVLSPRGGGEYLIGKAADYYHVATPIDGCPFPHRRHIEWFDKVLLKEDMSTNFVYSLGATLTIFSLDKYGKEIEALIKGKALTPAEKPERIRDVILSGLLELDGKQFEEFIQHLLDIVGFQTQVTQYSNDKGIDVVGVLNAEGLAEIKLQIQAKRYQKVSIASRVVREMKGALSLDEHGCIITTASFSKGAIEEADKQGHKTIKLIDGDELAGLILKHFGEIDDKYKTIFRVRKKKDYRIEDQFEISDSEDEGSAVVLDNKKAAVPDWDTLVCSAKEDGFNRAFLEQKAWWAVRIHPSRLRYIKNIAMYQVAPISQITYYGIVDRIEPYEGDEYGPNKYKLYLKGDPIKLENPVGIGANLYLKPQSPKYAKLADILKAISLDDVWG